MHLFQAHFLTYFHLLGIIASCPPPIHQRILEIHPSLPVCILLSHFGPLRIPALLPHADVSPSNHEFHFLLSLFPNGRRRSKSNEGTDEDWKGKDYNYYYFNSCMQIKNLNKEKEARFNTVLIIRKNAVIS